MILITSAKYVNPELQSEFGKIPPSFLPLGGKRLYEYQAKLFENHSDKIFLSLPESFKVSKSDKKKLDLLNITILKVADGLSLGESIVYSINMNLPIDNNLQILHGDTYLEHIKDIDNSISITDVDSNYDWTYLIQNNLPVFNIINKNIKNLNNQILSGYFNIKKPYQFVQSVVKRKYSFIEGLKLYSEKFTFEMVENDSWLDFGLVSNYFHSKKSITTERAFNELIIENGYVKKTSTFEGKLDGEINWFSNFPEELSLYIPRFNSNKDGLSYKTEYLYTNTLSELFVFGKLPSHIWKKVFESLKLFLEELHYIKTDDKKINFEYKYKTIARINRFANESKIDLDTVWIYNGESMPSINSIIDDLDSYISTKDKIFSFIHGDFCFSNVMYDFKSGDIKTFDPRGIDFTENVTVYGDSNYDYAKLMHSVVGLYDFVISKFYECTLTDYIIEFDIDVDEEVTEIQELFFEIFELQNKEEIYAVMIHLFLSMLPLHNDNRDKQNSLLANMFRLYKNLKEGI